MPTAAEQAQSYGIAYAVIASDRGLKAIFDQAVRGKWSADRFTAALRATTWYKTHSEQWRQTEALRLSDKKTYDANLAGYQANLRSLAAQMGARMTDAQISSIATTLYRYGYNDAQAKATIAQYVTADATSGTYAGQAQAAVQQLRQVAQANGQNYSDDWYLKAAQAVEGGTGDINTYMGQIRADAAGTYKQWADRLQAGENMQDIASNYIQRYSQLLEVDPNSVSLKDPIIDRALTQTSPDGQPAVQSLADFTKAVKQDPRWSRTDNARDEISQSMYQVGRMMGFA